MAENIFSIKINRWYAWQLFPGYCNVPYYSPILVKQVHPLADREDLLRLRFLNVFNSEGIQEVELDLRKLKQARDYLIWEVVYENNPALNHTAILSPITYGWLYLFAPDYMASNPPRHINGLEEDPQTYLDRQFGHSA